MQGVSERKFRPEFSLSSAAGLNPSRPDGSEPKSWRTMGGRYLCVYINSDAESALQTKDYIKSTIREVARTYTEYEMGSHCHTFQYDVINKLDWIVKARCN